MRHFPPLILPFLLIACQSAMLSGQPEQNTKAASWIEQRHVAQDGAFSFKYWLRAANPGANQILHVVVEGDGATWSKAGNPPLNPTPRRAIGREVASALPADALVLYVARPCQYLNAEQMNACPMRYWTRDRFADSVIASMNDAIARVKSSTGAQSLALSGYSGGGVIAAELALSRSDVTSLMTIASPLDLETWAQIHEVTPVHSPTASSALLSRLASLPISKRFYFGEKDKVVPYQSLVRIRKYIPTRFVHLIDGAGHAADWSKLIGINSELQSISN